MWAVSSALRNRPDTLDNGFVEDGAGPGAALCGGCLSTTDCSKRGLPTLRDARRSSEAALVGWGLSARLFADAAGLAGSGAPAGSVAAGFATPVPALASGLPTGLMMLPSGFTVRVATRRGVAPSKAGDTGS